MTTLEEIDKKYALIREAEDRYREAKQLFATGRKGEAHRVIIRLLDDYPEHPKLLNAAASLCRADGNFDRAEEYFLRVIEKASDYIYAYNNLCLLYCETDRHEKAAKYARLTLQIMKSSPIPWDTLGLYYLTRGEVQRALEHFAAAYEYDPSYTRAAYNIACCYSIMGETDNALEYLVKALDNERRIEIAEDDKDLENIRDSEGFRKVLNEARGKFNSE